MQRDERVEGAVEGAFAEFVDRGLRGRFERIESFVGGREGLGTAQCELLAARLEALFGSREAGAGSELPFEEFGGCRLVERKRISAQSVAFAAERLSDGVAVELAVIRPGGGAGDEVRFDQLARSLPGLRHPGVVAVLALGEELGLRYVVSETCDAPSLDEVLRRSGALPAARAARIALEVARALGAARERGILHLAVEPANVHVAEDGNALLHGFGTASPSRLPAFGITDGRSLPYQAAPEQMAARAAVDERTDLYSLGATLYRCLTGAEPIEATTLDQLARRIRRRPPVPPRERNPALSRDLEAVTLAAMAKRPGHRYRSADDLARDLEAVLEARAIRPPPSPLPQKALRLASRHPKAAAAAIAVPLAIGASLAAVWLSGRADARAFEHELAAAISAESSGDLESAVRAYDRALAIAPADRRALAGRISAQSNRDRARAEDALSRSRRLLADFRADSEAARELERELAPLRLALIGRPVTREELSRLGTGERRARDLANALEDASTQLLASLDRALAFGASEADVHAIRAAAHLERWRDAVARADSAGERRFRELVERDDSARAHAAELAGTGTVSLETRPAAARVSLFRFVEEAELRDDGDARLVPVPIDGDGEPAPAPIEPGSWALRVVRGRGDVRAGDLIVRVAGHPIRDTVLVAEDRGELKALDRVVEIDGRPVRDVYDAAALGAASTDPRQPRSLVFERGGERLAVEASDSAEIGFPSLASLLGRKGAPVTVFRSGDLLELESEPGLEVRATATPLLDVPACSAIKAPATSRKLARGSYLALVRAEHFEPLRVPFVIEPGRETRLELRLDPIGTTPPGFVFVRGGPCPLGGDPEAPGSAPAEIRDVADFWISEREVTEVEYAGFLNDPKTLAEIETSSVPIRVPRDGTAPHGLWKRASDGTFLVPEPARELPVGSISVDDAHAYARWRTARSRRSAENLVYSLPTEAEWEKAARGVDGRRFVFGSRFSPQWTKGLFARGEVGVGEPGLRFPVDESVYGVFDLGGSRCEPCADAWAGSRSSSAIRGGGNASFAPASFRAAARSGARSGEPISSLGIRLVVRNARERGPSPLDR